MQGRIQICEGRSVGEPSSTSKRTHKLSGQKVSSMRLILCSCVSLYFLCGHSGATKTFVFVFSRENFRVCVLAGTRTRKFLPCGLSLACVGQVYTFEYKYVPMCVNLLFYVLSHCAHLSIYTHIYIITVQHHIYNIQYICMYRKHTYNIIIYNERIYVHKCA